MSLSPSWAASQEPLTERKESTQLQHLRLAAICGNGA